MTLRGVSSMPSNKKASTNSWLTIPATRQGGRLPTPKAVIYADKPAPYGYDRMLIDEAGNHQQRVRNGEKFAKPRSWHVTLVPADDPEKVRVAKWMFDSYANEDKGLRSIVNDLNAQGIPGPRGGPWHVGTVREILKNESLRWGLHLGQT